MVLVGGGVLFPLLWPLKAAAPSSVVAAVPASVTVDPVIQKGVAGPPSPAPTDPAGSDIALFSCPAIVEADAAVDPAAPSLLATFTWNGNGGDDDWDTTDNWTSVGCSNCYPDDCNDDATIPYTGGGWDIVAVAIQMDDLTISSSIDFTGSGGSPPVLKADSITLTGSNDIEITISNATVKTFGCP